MKVIPNVQTERIAISHEGRAVTLVKVTTSETFGADQGKVRVLLFAQQHGDEPSGKEALLLLLAKAFSGNLAQVLERVDLLLVPQVNPDGSERRQRRTTHGIDLNRAHVVLNSPEVRALHDLFHIWMPHVTLDIHEYCALSSRWVESGVLRTADVQLGTLTNLNSSPAIRAYQRERMLPFVAGEMARQGYQCHEYVVGFPGSGVRHSTTEINDGRQSFGLLNTLSFLQEGRKWRGFTERMEYRVATQLASIEALLCYCRAQADEILALVRGERRKLRETAGTEAVVRMDHIVEGNKPLLIPGCDAHLGKDLTVALSPYHSTVKPLRSVALPSAYLIPAEYARVAGLLAAHRVRVIPVEDAKSVRAEVPMIEKVEWEVLEGESLARPQVDFRVGSVNLRPGDMVVPTGQLHALFLATLLEAESMWGLARYRQFASLMKEGAFPFKRIFTS